MRSKRTITLRMRLLGAILTLATTLSALPAHAAGPEMPQASASAAGLAQHDGVLRLADGSIALSVDAGPAPARFASNQRYGSAVSASFSFAASTTRLQLRYQAELPAGASLRVDVRGSADGSRWLPWASDLPSGAVIGFALPVRFAQYRVSMLGGTTTPSVRDLQLSATKDAATVQAPAADQQAVAPTFRIRATRQGMIGGRTANGFVIPPHARFVSLPSWSVLSTRGGDEYKVRITYRGRSTVVPVYDVGPYSERDDYWDARRDGYPELERGWPQDHAAYYEGHSGGRADKAYVRYPTAMDVGDGAWLDDLGIVGDQAEVEVTYLWLGQDPLAGPTQRSADAPEQLVDELGGDFWQSTATLNASAMGCGFGRHAYWTGTVVAQDQSDVVARWQPVLPLAGFYEVYVHVPDCSTKRAPTGAARYVVQHSEGAVEVAVNQREQTGWVLLGRFPFNADSSGFVQLSDLAGEGGNSIWFDNAKWVRVQ